MAINKSLKYIYLFINTNYGVFTFGKRSLRIFGLKIWNGLPYRIKS